MLPSLGDVWGQQGRHAATDIRTQARLVIMYIDMSLKDLKHELHEHSIMLHIYEFLAPYSKRRHKSQCTCVYKNVVTVQFWLISSCER